MSENPSSDVRTFPCPSPDGCPFVAGGAVELLEHVNSEHAGEYTREDWPDTAAGRASRAEDSAEADDQQEDDPGV